MINRAGGGSGTPGGRSTTCNGIWARTGTWRRCARAIWRISAAASQPSSVVAFGVTVPSAGTYRPFFEFRHLDEVRIAAFTVNV